MSMEEFDNGYWYATELKTFARQLGIHRASTLRKDELEQVLRTFLRTGVLPDVPAKQNTLAVRDSERGLRLGLEVVKYTNDVHTKEFLLREAKELDPEFRVQSGTRYRLNRWREAQMSAGNQITYGDLVRHFVELNSGDRVPLRTEHGRYNNFVADYAAAYPEASRREMIEAWKELKELDAPKTFAAWQAHRTL